MTHNSEFNEKTEGLPFDPFAILYGVRRKLKWIVAILVVAAVVGVLTGKYAGSRSWDSYCVMLFQPPSVELSGRVYNAPAVQTQLSLVKLRQNLEETRDRLRLAVSLETLASACSIDNPRDTQLLIIQATSNSAVQSAAIANTLSDVFVANQREVRNGELLDALSYLEGRRQDLAAKLRRAQEQSGPLVAKDPEDMQREIRSCQTKLDALDVIYEKGLSERKSLEIQFERVGAIMEEVKQEIANEESESAAVQGLSNLNIRVERIREAIMDERAEQTNDITLSQWKNRLDYDKELLDKGYLSKAVYDHEQAQHEKLKAQVVDSDQIKAWKLELNDLYDKIRPSDNKDSASAPILRDLMLRSFSIELQLKGIVEHIIKTKDSRDGISEQLDVLLASRNVSGAERWQVQAWRDELIGVENSIAMVESLNRSNTSDFQIVSPAEASPLPSKSNRRMLAIGSFGLIVVFGFAIILGLELIQTRVRTTDEVSMLIDEPVLATITHQAALEGGELDPLATEQLRRATKAIMKSRSGRRILVLGCHHGDGCSTLTKGIASCMARQQHAVTILEGDLRSPKSGLTDLLDSNENAVGLTELIGDQDASFDGSLYGTTDPYLKYVPRGCRSIDPDLLGSSKMGTVVQEISEECDFLLVEGPPICGYTDAEFLSEHADMVLLVVRSQHCTRSELKSVVGRVQRSGTPLLGVVLNNVDPGYVRGV